MYGRSAFVYDDLHRFLDYDAAARALHATIMQRRPGARHLLDVACGTGKHLEVLRQWYEVEGVDINAGFLTVARQRLGDVRFYQQDMAVMDTGRRYDVITCLFGSIAYVRTPENLRHTLLRFEKHLTESGLIIVEPFFSPEQYWTNRVTLNVTDLPELKTVWMYTSPPPVNNIATVDYHHMIGTPSGIEYFVERHELGLFTSEQYLEAFSGAGLEATLDPTGFFGRGAYIASRRP